MVQNKFQKSCSEDGLTFDSPKCESSCRKCLEGGGEIETKERLRLCCSSVAGSTHTIKEEGGEIETKGRLLKETEGRPSRHCKSKGKCEDTEGSGGCRCEGSGEGVDATLLSGTLW